MVLVMGILTLKAQKKNITLTITVTANVVAVSEHVMLLLNI